MPFDRRASMGVRVAGRYALGGSPERFDRELPGPGCRRPVRIVDVHVVEVEKEGLGEVADHLADPAVHAGRAVPQALLVEALEPPAEAAVGIEVGGALAHDRARRDRGGRVAVLPEDLGQGRNPGRNPHAPVRLADELQGRPAGEDGVDRREGARSLGVGAVEDVAAPGEGRDVGGGVPVIAVEVEALGAQGVDQYDDHVGARGWGGLRRLRRAAPPHCERRHEGGA